MPVNKKDAPVLHSATVGLAADIEVAVQQNFSIADSPQHLAKTADHRFRVQ